MLNIKKIQQKIKQDLDQLIDSDQLGDKERSGVFNRKIEKQVEERFVVKHGITLNSGTAGLLSALMAIGITENDEVIVDPFFKYSTAATLHLKAIPVYADLSQNDFLIDVNSVKKLITKKTKAIIATATFGLLPNLVELRKLANENGLFLIEDCAQALAAKIGTQFAGTVGHIGVFSFQSFKHINAGEGGMIVTNETTLLKKIYAAKEHGWLQEEGSGTEPLGHMFRMPETTAVIVAGKFHFLSEIVHFHQTMAALFNKVIANFDWIVPQFVDQNKVHTYNRWACYIADKAKLKWLKNELKKLESEITVGFCEKGLINNRPIYLNMASAKPKLTKPQHCPVADALRSRIVHLLITTTKPVGFYEIQAEILCNALQAVENKNNNPELV